MTMIPQYGVAVGSALTTVVHAEDAQPNEIIQGQKRKRTLPPKIMVSKPQPRYTNVPSGRQAIKSGLQYAIRSRPWRGGRGGYANQGGRQGQDTTRDRTNDHPYGGGRHPQSDDAMDRRIKIVSVSDGTTRNTKPYKRTRPDSESSGSPSASTTTPSAQASTTHVQPALVSTSSTSTNVRLPKRRKVNRPGIHDVGEEIIIGPRSPEGSTAPSARRVIDAQPPPAPAAIDLTFLDEPGLYVMTKSPQSTHHDDGLTSPLYIPFIPATVDLRPSSPLLLSLSTLPSREVDHSQPSKKTRPEVTREHQTQKGRDRAQNSNKEARPRSPSPFLLPSLRRKTSQELYVDNVHSLSPTLKPALPTRQNVTTRTGTITPPSPSPKLATPFLPPLNLPPSPPLHSTTIMGDSAGVADSTPIKRIASGIVKEETLISPSVATPSAGPSRRLITSGCEFYPMPESCSKTHPDFKENRKTFAKEKWRHLQSFGFKRKKCTVREDGLAIEWESPVPVWSDTYLKEVTSAPSIADAIQRSLSQNHRSTESITTNASLRRKKETVPPRSPLLSSTDKGKSRADVVPEEPPRNDADLIPVSPPAPVSPSPPPRNLPSVKKPIHLTLAHKAKNGTTPVPNDDLDVDTNDTQHASHHPKLKAAPKKADTKGRRVIMSLEEALMASMSHNASHIRRIKKSKAMKGHFEDEDEDEEDESDSEEESGVSDEDDNDDDDEEEEEEEASPDSKSKRKRSRSVSAPVKRARLSGFRKDRHTSSNSATNKPKVVEVIDLTMDDSSDEEGPNSRAGGQAVTAKEASAPAPAPAPDTISSNGNAGPEAHAVADADLDVGREEQTEPEVKKMVFKPNHVPRRRARSPPVFTDPWKSVLVSLEETERGDQEGGVDPCVVLGDRSEVGSSGGVDRDVQQGGGEEEQARQQADGGVDDGVTGTLGIEDDDELMYPPTPEVPIAVIPTLGVEVDSTHVGVDALSGSAAAITPQEGDDFPLSSMHGIAPTTDENATNTTAQEVVDGLPAALEPLSVPVLSQPEDMVLELPDNNAGGVVDGERYLLNGSDNTKEASVSASPTIHMKIDEDEVVGGAMDLAVSGQGAGDSDEIEEVTQRFLERYISFFDSDREMLGEAYTDSALFSCSAVGCQPSAGSLVSNSSSEPSPAISAVSRALSGNPKISQGSSAIIDVLKQLGPFQFYRHEDFSVYYDLAPLPRPNGADSAHARHGDGENPNVEVGVSAQAAERYLLSVHAQLYNAANPMDVADRLAVDQSFLLCRGSGALGSSESCAAGGIADTSHRVDASLAAWPLTILSHQMTLRRTPLLSEEKLAELLPWAQEILR